MKLLRNIVILLATWFGNENGYSQSLAPGDSASRPQVHFSPKEKWMNDPNGMVYYKGLYHLFFQHNPNSSVWGPMHWGHATSTDLIHWNRQPIKIFPDSLGTIFSGSAVLDRNNTSGFGRNGKLPLVAIFTQHDEKGEKQGRNDFQNQSLAYSLDNGKTWIKYKGNPVLRNPGYHDFRDPKVMWHEATKRWIMSLAAGDRIFFYSSPDLRNWKKESEFGADAGAHGGVWECPDLFSMEYNGKLVWVLIVNINPGGPNQGSATQYFLGDFDGKKFSPLTTHTKWLDYGPDEYAGVTWANTGKRKIFLGWMSNWLYANVVPTETWRNAMTIPRELKIQSIGNDMFVTSEPVHEIAGIKSKPVVITNMALKGSLDISKKIKNFSLPALITLALEQQKDFSIQLSNEAGERLSLGYEEKTKEYFIDRTRSGKTEFQKDFASKHIAPRLSANSAIDLTLVIDVTSVELFADDGLTVMTEIFFPNRPYDKIMIRADSENLIKKLEYSQLKSIW